MKKIRDIIRLMRPTHYIKNILLLIPGFFDGRLFSRAVFPRLVGGFLAFSLLSSVVYIINDLCDADADRNHEIKRHRPIAAGRVTPVLAVAVAVVLFAASIWINALCSEQMVQSACVLLGYLLANLGYSLGLKNVPICDVAILVSGFLLRVLYGAMIINLSLSSWLYLTIISLSFYLSLGKRRNELRMVGSEGNTRPVLRYYSVEFLDRFMYLCLGLAITFYSLWSADADIIEKYHTDKLIWTIPMVLLLMMKYSADVETESYGDPVDVITQDKVLLLMCAVYAALLFFMLYIPL